MTINDDSIRAIVAANPQISTEKIAKSLNINNSSACQKLKKLNYVLKLDVWVSFIERKKQNGCFVANALLGRSKNEVFFYWIVTGDEKWVVYDDS